MAPNLDVKSESWLDLSIGSNKQYFRQQVYTDQQQTTIASHRHSIGGEIFHVPSFERNQHFKKNQHLLITLRQQSYLNRSSNSLSSNLSNSIDLNSSLVGSAYKSDKPATYSQVKLKRESKRLKALRDKLKQRKPLPADRFRGDEKDDNETNFSPIVRSISSFSERLSGKLTHFRHSWKHFLYNYNQRKASSVSSGQEDHQQTAIVMENQNCNDHHQQLSSCRQMELNKRQLTDDWVRRHHHLESRPKSLQIISQQENVLATPSSKAHSKQVTGAFSQVPPPRKHSIERARVSQASSSTLVSSQERHNNNNQLISPPSSSNSTLSIQGNDQPEMRKQSSPRAAQSILQSQQLLAPAPTSDYWSSNTASSSKLAAPNFPELAMGADQEYYLEVARAAALEQANNSSNVLQDFDEEQLANMTRNNIVISEPANNATMVNSFLDEDYDDYAVPADESCRLHRSQVELVQMIGEGQKGYVFLGKLQSKDGRSIADVAIKTLKYETDQLIDKLMREAAMMRQLEHPHIIKFIGVCPETPALIAMELAEFGEVKQYLKVNKNLISVSQLVLFTFQISTALSYLESKQYVHRDVAARNVLVCSHSCVKLADFGLSRNLQAASLNEIKRNNYLIQGQDLLSDQGDNYVAATRGKLPVRWLAPESLAFRRFTSSSDVWMFAVCSWELFHFGQLRPWAHIRNTQVLLAIESGQRLARPANCPERLYQLMLQCWSYAPVQRPKFRELKQSLWSIYLNEKAREQLELEQQQQEQQRILAASRQHQDRRLMMMMVKNNNNNKRRVQPVACVSPQIRANLSGYSSAASLAADHSNNSSRSSSMNSLARQQAKLMSKQAEPNQSRRQLEMQRRLESNMKRFERAPGQVLQKQRSQGSISVAQQAEQARRFAGRRQGYDDNELLARQRARPAHYQEDADAEDEEESSSDLESSRAAAWLAPGPRVSEPTYEGLQPAFEVAMIRGDPASPVAVIDRRVRGSSARPVSWASQQKSPPPPAEQKFANVLDSLKSAPLKARLIQSGPPEDRRGQEGTAELEAARQLALHQRLLGNIRPSSAMGRAERQRRLAEQEPSARQDTTTAAVDQSLQLLESLISDGNQRHRATHTIQLQQPGRLKGMLFVRK